MEIKKRKSENRKLYFALIAVLACLAITVGITTGVANRRKAASSLKADIDGIEAVIGENAVLDAKADADKPLDTKNADTVKAEEKTLKGEEVPEKPEKDAEKSMKDEAESSSESEAESVAIDKTEQIPAVDLGKSVSSEGEIPVFSSPVDDGAVSVIFSDEVPVFSVTMNDYRVHTGVDVLAESGSAVKSAADGVIGAIWDDPLMGKCMTVVHSGGAVTTYKGVDETVIDGIAEGVFVEAGQVIAAVGDSALIEVAEEPHVHFELSLGGVPVDPCGYIEFGKNVGFEG